MLRMPHLYAGTADISNGITKYCTITHVIDKAYSFVAYMLNRVLNEIDRIGAGDIDGT